MKSKKIPKKEQIPIKSVRTSLIEIFRIQDGDVDQESFGYEINELSEDEMPAVLITLKKIEQILIDNYFDSNE